MLARSVIACGLVSLGVALSGCVGTSRHVQTPEEHTHVSLVLPPQTMIDRDVDAPFAPPFSLPWEFGRNDSAINYRPFGAVMPYGWTETYTRDRFHTFGGRVHEHSRFEIRSYRIR